MSNRNTLYHKRPDGSIGLCKAKFRKCRYDKTDHFISWGFKEDKKDPNSSGRVYKDGLHHYQKLYKEKYDVARDELNRLRESEDHVVANLNFTDYAREDSYSLKKFSKWLQQSKDNLGRTPKYVELGITLSDSETPIVLNRGLKLDVNPKLEDWVRLRHYSVPNIQPYWSFEIDQAMGEKGTVSIPADTGIVPNYIKNSVTTYLKNNTSMTDEEIDEKSSKVTSIVYGVEGELSQLNDYSGTLANPPKEFVGKMPKEPILIPEEYNTSLLDPDRIRVITNHEDYNYVTPNFNLKVFEKVDENGSEWEIERRSGDNAWSFSNTYGTTHEVKTRLDHHTPRDNKKAIFSNLRKMGLTERAAIERANYGVNLISGVEQVQRDHHLRVGNNLKERSSKNNLENDRQLHNDLYGENSNDQVNSLLNSYL